MAYGCFMDQRFTPRPPVKCPLRQPGKHLPPQKRFASALEQPNMFYNRAMMMDPWRPLNPIVGRILVRLPSAMGPSQKRSVGKDLEFPKYPNKRSCLASPPASVSSLVANRHEYYAGFSFSTSPSPTEVPVPPSRLLTPSPAVLPLPSARLLSPPPALLPMACAAEN